MSVNQHKEMGNIRSNNGEEYVEKRAPKRRSTVWNHFTLDKVTKKAMCNHCNKDLQGNSQQGTSHLKRHLKNKHPHEYASAEFQSSIKKITAEDTTAIRGEELVSSVQRNIECVASRSGDKKRAPLTGEEREDDHLVKKRARLNKEQQLKRPSEESGLNAEGAILIGEKNNMTVQLPVQSGLQNRNCLTLELGWAFKSLVTGYQQLIEQKQQQQEAQIKELKEALDRAKAEIREEKEARVAAEQKVRSLTEERNALQNGKLGSEDEARRWDEKKWMANTAQLMTDRDTSIRVFFKYTRSKISPLIRNLKFLSTKSCKNFSEVHLTSLEYTEIVPRGESDCRGENDCRMLTSAHVQESYSRKLFDNSFGTELTDILPLSERCPTSPFGNWHEFSYLDHIFPSPINEWNEHSLMDLRLPSPNKEWNEYSLMDQDFDIDNNKEMF